MARGAAYAERSHTLPVERSRRAHVHEFRATPLEFLKFAQQRLPDATAEDFLPRALYGEYLESVLLEAEARHRPTCSSRVRGEVCAIERTAAHRHIASSSTTAIPSRRRCRAGPRQPAACDTCRDTDRHRGPPRYVSDPWAQPLEFQARRNRTRHRHRPHNGGHRHRGSEAANEQVVFPRDLTPRNDPALANRVFALPAAKVTAPRCCAQLRSPHDTCFTRFANWRTTCSAAAAIGAKQ